MRTVAAVSGPRGRGPGPTHEASAAGLPRIVAVTAVSRAELGKPREAVSSKVGLPTNPDSSFSPAVRAAATGPLSQTQRGESKKEEGKKPHTDSLGNTFENNISRNKEVCEAPGSAVSDLISSPNTRPSRCRARLSWLRLGLPRRELPPGKMFLLEKSTHAQPDRQGSDEQMLSPVSTSQVDRCSLKTAGFQALSLMLRKQMQ